MMKGRRQLDIDASLFDIGYCEGVSYGRQKI